MKRTESEERRKEASRCTKAVAARKRWGFLVFTSDSSSRPSDASAGDVTGSESCGGGKSGVLLGTLRTSGGRRCGFPRSARGAKGSYGEGKALPCDYPPAVERGEGNYGAVHLQQLFVVADDVGRGLLLLLCDDDGQESFQGSLVVGATRNLAQITERIHMLRFLLDDQLEILFCLFVLRMMVQKDNVHFPTKNRPLPSSNTQTRLISHACAPRE